MEYQCKLTVDLNVLHLSFLEAIQNTCNQKKYFRQVFHPQSHECCLFLKRTLFLLQTSLLKVFQCYSTLILVISTSRPTHFPTQKCPFAIPALPPSPSSLQMPGSCGAEGGSGM